MGEVLADGRGVCIVGVGQVDEHGTVAEPSQVGPLRAKEHIPAALWGMARELGHVVHRLPKVSVQFLEVQRPGAAAKIFEPGKAIAIEPFQEIGRLAKVTAP